LCVYLVKCYLSPTLLAYKKQESKLSVFVLEHQKFIFLRQHLQVNNSSCTAELGVGKSQHTILVLGVISVANNIPIACTVFCFLVEQNLSRDAAPASKLMSNINRY
jgi:hypothetical protein